MALVRESCTWNQDQNSNFRLTWFNKIKRFHFNNNLIFVSFYFLFDS